MLIATHDGSFHADETVACAILTYIYENAQIIRSRDPRELERADLIIDVSGINDAKHFDHHSPAFTEQRDNGIHYATAGLMWKKYGLQYLQRVVELHPEIHRHLQLSDTIYKAAFERIDREVMYMVDLNDNGQLNSYLHEIIPTHTPEEAALMDKFNEFYRCSPDIPYLVAMQNLPGVNGDVQNKNFMATVRLLRTLLVNTALNALYTEAGIAQVLELYDGGEILIMHEKLPWTAAVLTHFDLFKNCKLAVYPDRKRGWRVQSLPFSVAERFKNKITAPKAWRGLDGEDLDDVVGLKGLIFVHRAGFTGGAMEFETQMEMARLWLQEGEVQH